MVVYKDSQEERKLDPVVRPRENARSAKTPVPRKRPFRGNARFRDAFKTKRTCILSPVDGPTH